MTIEMLYPEEVKRDFDDYLLCEYEKKQTASMNILALKIHKFKKRIDVVGDMARQIIDILHDQTRVS